PDPAQAAAKSSAAAAAAPGRAGPRAGRGPEGLGQAARAQAGVAPCYPRLAADDQGRVWMGFRGRVGGHWRGGVGSVWFEFVSRLEGDSWTPAAWVPHSNNVLDNRPAVVAGPDHALMVFFSGDGRGEILPPRVADPHVDAGAPAGAPADAGGGIVGA